MTESLHRPSTDMPGNACPDGREPGGDGGALARARQLVLHGGGLPDAWAGQAQWRLLDVHFGRALNFLIAWAAWRADTHRPGVLHCVACTASPPGADELLRAAPQCDEVQPLAQQLAEQCWGLLPGVHRLAFEGGRVLLTLYVGDAQALLRQQQPTADTVCLGPASDPDPWRMQTLKAVARCCRRGTRLAAWGAPPSLREALAASGFTVQAAANAPAGCDLLQATFNPPWQPRAGQPPLPHAALPDGQPPGHCLVVGAGLAGAAVAASLARRGWRVTVLDASAAPAAGASGLPAGVFASHVSPDDSVLSRLSRAGVRTTLQTLAALAPLAKGVEWDDTGVLEHGVDTPVRLAWEAGPGLDWSRPPTPQELHASHLRTDAPAAWHARGGWVSPPALVRRLLGQPGIAWHGDARVARLQRDGDGLWRALDDAGNLLDATLPGAELAVVCAGPASAGVAGVPLPLQMLRGQLAWGWHADAPSGAAWPAHPVNGHGNLVPCAPLAGPGQAPDAVTGTAHLGWVLGSTFERDQATLPVSPADEAAGRAANRDKLARLQPALAPVLAPAFAPGLPAVHTWAAVRCAAPDRLPLVGPLDAQALPGLWVSTAMGARGLTLALLCGELLAARLHGEPLPLQARLAQALASERL